MKQKSSEGVKVLILLWNEKLSTERHINGLMRTHDVETQEFFNGTNVECVLVQRAKYDSLLSYEFVSTNYAHHQKTIVLDSPVDDYSSRKVHKITNVRSDIYSPLLLLLCMYCK